jgi:hypothetical protein
MDEGKTKEGEKDSEFREMQQQLREAQHVIAQFYQERREMKRNLLREVMRNKHHRSRQILKVKHPREREFLKTLRPQL